MRVGRGYLLGGVTVINAVGLLTRVSAYAPVVSTWLMAVAQHAMHTL